MKVTFEFQDEDKHNNLQIYLMAEGMFSVLSKFQEELCKVYTGPGDLADAVYADKWNTVLYDLMYQHGVDLDKVE